MGISYNGNDEKDYELHNLSRLQKLEELKIEALDFPNLAPVFPKTLKKLTLSGLGLSWEKFGEVIGSLPKLQVLKLRDEACIGETWETSDGGFRRLELLVIEESHFENWETESSHFPKLKLLVLRRCWELGEIPEAIGDISTLEVIEIDDCNGPLLESANDMQAYLEDMYGDGVAEIRVIKDSRSIVGGEAADQIA